MNYLSYVDMVLQKNERLYRISLPLGAPFTECQEVLIEALAEVNDLIKKHEEKVAADKASTDGTDTKPEGE